MRHTQHARSSVSGAVPSPSDVLVGEIIVNFADRTLRTKNGSGAIIRINQNFLVSNIEPGDPNIGDSYLATSGQAYAYFDNGSSTDWHELFPAEDLTGLLPKTGGTMTGQITLPGGGAGSQAITVTEAAALAAATVGAYLPKAGGTMTGQITLPGGATGSQAVSVTQMNAAILAAIPPDLSGVLLKTGGTMSGQITLPGGGTGNQAASANELAAAIASHVAQPDPHPNYTLSTELTAEHVFNAATYSAIGHTHAQADVTGLVAALAAKANAADLLGKKGIWVDAAALRPKVTNGCAIADYDSGSNDMSLRGAYFDPTTQEYGIFKLAFGSIYNNSTVTFVPYWTNTGGAVGQNVVWSLAGPMSRSPPACSGDMYSGVPITWPVWVSEVVSAAREIPKSISRGPSSASSTLDGLRSRCTSPAACRA